VVVFLNPTMSAALDRIAERAGDVRRAFTPAAVPQRDDVATSAPSSGFTLDPLSVAAPDGTYFIVSDSRGHMAYTRDGAFALRDGRLVAPDGASVFGVRAPGAELSELDVEPVDAALGRVGEPHIESDGRLVYRRNTLDPRSGARNVQRVVIGRIALARFPAGTRLDQNDPNHSLAPRGQTPEVGLPGDDGFAQLATMQRERSRVNLDESLARLDDAYLAFDALAAAEAAKGHLGKTVMDLLK
jgi:flagellar basal body rod protein FlgG